MRTDLQQTEGPLSGDQLKVGTHIVKYEAADHAQNKKACQFRIFVRDREAPRIHNCPKDFTIQTYKSSNWAAFPTWQIPTAIDNVDKAVSVTRVTGVDPGTKISVGTTKNTKSVTIIYQATDSAANRAECKFSINLVKNQQQQNHEAYSGSVPLREEDVGGGRTEENLNVENEGVQNNFRRRGAANNPHRATGSHVNVNAQNQRSDFRDARKGARRRKTWLVVFWVFVGVAVIATIVLVVVFFFVQEKSITPDSRYDLSKGTSPNSSSGWCSCCSQKDKRKQRLGKRV